MARKEHVGILMQGVETWNNWRKKHPTIHPDLSHAYFWGMNLAHANFCRVDLQGANLSESNLSGSNFVEANLREANLDKCNLGKVELFVTDLREADLNDANLNEASLYGVDFREASLRHARFWGTEVYESNFTKADLSFADFWMSRLIRCDMTDAIVDDAFVKDMYLHDLKGVPKVPTRLRMERQGKKILFHEDARSVFHRPAILEVHLNTKLRDLELACFQMHLAGLHQSKIGTKVFMVGQRYVGNSTVFRLQATTYNEIYEVLLDILAPFPTSRNIDWERTFSEIPAERYIPEMKALCNPEFISKSWPFASRLTRVFQSFQSLHVTELKHIGDGSPLQMFPFKDEKKEKEYRQQQWPEPVPQHFMIIPQGERYEIRVSDQPIGKANNQE